MGKCTSSPVRKKTTQHHDREYVDTESFQHKKLPKLYFHANLANVILKKYPYVPQHSLRTKQHQSFD